MNDWENGLAVNFSSTGLWNYNGSSWNLLTTSDYEDMQHGLMAWLWISAPLVCEITKVFT